MIPHDPSPFSRVDRITGGRTMRPMKKPAEGSIRIIELGYGQCVEAMWIKGRWVTQRTFWKQDEEKKS